MLLPDISKTEYSGFNKQELIRYTLRENFLEKHNFREHYERVNRVRSVKINHRIGLNIFMANLYKACPKKTGYGKTVGIRYKRLRDIHGKLTIRYKIIVGSERDVNNHQLRKAPYIALLNGKYTDKGEDSPRMLWINKAVEKAKKDVANMGIFVSVRGPVVASHYPKGAPAGFEINLFFYERG